MNTESGDLQLFLIPTVLLQDRAKLESSVSSRVVADLSGILSADQFTAAVASDGHLYAWPLRSQTEEQAAWEAMGRGDYLAFHTATSFVYVASVTTKLQSAELCAAIWNSDGQDYDLIVFLEKPTRINVSLENLAAYLNPSDAVIKLTETATATIRSSYTTIRDFVLDRLVSLHDVPSNYLILRMNHNSDWNDKENTYHYGRIANYTKIKSGSAVILDRKTSQGVEVIGRARVTKIIELEDRSFEASLDRFDQPSRAYTDDELRMLKVQPGYNVQHSIRPISSDLYRLLSGSEVVPIGQTIDQRLINIQELIGWPLPRIKFVYDTLRESRALLVAGPPGTGKTFLAQAFRENLTTDESDSEIVVFHPNYSYEDFIQGIRPKLAGTQLGYELHNGVFYRISERATLNPDRTFIIVIDELNRGNVPKIFGEILFSLEYRDRDHSIALASGTSFSVPSNLWIIATMNTADRSVTALDAALRRRFRQLTLEPDYQVLQSFLEKTQDPSIAADAVKRLQDLNEELLGILNDRGRLIGHYFLMVKDLSPSQYATIWGSQIEPVISEYLFEQPDELNRLADVFLRK